MIFVRGLTPVVVVVLALACAAGAAPATKPVAGQKQALEAVRRAAASGQLTPTETAAARAEIARAANLVRGLPVLALAARQCRALATRRVRRPSHRPARSCARRPAEGERRLLRRALPARAAGRHRRRGRARLPLVPRTLPRVPPARRVRDPERAPSRAATPRRRRRSPTRSSHVRCIRKAAASSGSTTSTTPEAARRGPPAWRRPSRHRRSRAPPTLVPPRRRHSLRRRAPPTVRSPGTCSRASTAGRGSASIRSSRCRC